MKRSLAGLTHPPGSVECVLSKGRRHAANLCRRSVQTLAYWRKAPPPRTRGAIGRWRREPKRTAVKLFFAKTSTQAGLAGLNQERWGSLLSSPRRMLAIMAGVAAFTIAGGTASPALAQAANAAEHALADESVGDQSAVEQTAAVNPAMAKPNLQFGTIGLSEADIDTYNRIFAFQDKGEWDRADRLMVRLTDHRLMGHVLFQRYMHPTAWTARFSELSAWLDKYADHPGAQSIYALAMKRRPNGATAPKHPVLVSRLMEGNTENFGFSPPPVTTREVLSPAAQRKSRAHLAKLRDWVRRDLLTKSMDYIQAHQAEIDPFDRDVLLGQIVAAFFRLEKDAEALAVAKQVLGNAAEMVPNALWYGGLAAWRLGQFDAAYPLFTALSKSAWASPWDRSAGGYWAARASLRVRQPQMMTTHLQEAARFPHTFYGIIATRWLGLDGDFRWEAPQLTRSHLSIIARTPAAYRAVGLLQVGEAARAEQELQRIDPKGDYLITEALVALAEAGKLPRLSLALASNFLTEDGATYDQALFPLPNWAPPGGFRTDPALVYAFIRQESRFAVSARSSAGARGLMQVMPATARYIVRQKGLPASILDDLDDPVNSVVLGDAYLQHLMDQPDIQDNLIKLAAAYNSGPGNLSKWNKRIGADDPLMFIEMMPMAETRNHVERVLAFYWLYRLRLGQVPTSLDDVVQGDWPRFRQQEARELMFLQTTMPKRS